MIKIYDKNNNFIKGIEDYKEPRVEQELNIADTLSLSFPLKYKDILEEEGYLELKEYGRFVIKEVNFNIESISIVAKQDLEVFMSWTGNKAYITKTMQFILDDLLAGTGWTAIADTGIKRTVTGRNLNKLDYILKAIDVFKYEIVFDSKTKTIYAKNTIGAYKGAYFHDEVNLKSLTSSSDTYDFATRIIPLGLDGMDIREINGGKNYIEDKTYSNKTITVEWIDERYEVKENLKRDATKKLETLSKPYKNYSCNVQDLSRNSEYEFLAYEVGDTVDIIDREKEIKEKQRIIKKTIYLQDSEKDSVEIANRPREFSYDDEIEEIKGQISYTEASLELLEDRIVGKVETLDKKVDENVTTINKKVGELELTDSSFRTRISSVESKASRNTSNIASNTSLIEQTDDSIRLDLSQEISSSVSDVVTSTNKKFASINLELDQINLEVGEKIGADEVVSSINVQPSSVKIDTKNLDLSGNLNLRGKFANYDSVSGEKAVELADSKLDFYDYDGSTRTTPVGTIFSSRSGGVTNRVGTAFNNQANATISIGYATGSGYNDYMVFDKDKVMADTYPIRIVEPTRFENMVRIRGDNRLWLGANSSISEVGAKLRIRGHDNYGVSLGSANRGGIIDWDPSTTGSYPIALRNNTAILANMEVRGNFNVTGSKNAVVKTGNYGQRAISAYETAEYYFGDIGSGLINEDGECLVYIDDIFAETINTNINYHVFTQKYNGNINEIIRENNYFIVKGEVGTEFSWEIKAKRKGYEHVRLEVPQDEFEVNVELSSIENDNYNILSAVSEGNKELNEILNGVLDFNLVDELLI